MSIVIDSREAKLLEFLKTHSDITVNYTVKQLSVGDIQLVVQGCTVIIERKTLSDLWSSITSSRYNDQKTRLLQTNSQIVYILEGNLSKIPEKFKKMTYGMMINSQFNHNIKIIPTSNIESTWYCIYNIFTKMPFSSELVKTLECPLSKGDLVQGNFHNHQLMLIKGLSFPMSQVILTEWKTVTKLIQHYLTLDQIQGEKLLKDLVVCNGKTERKLGPVLSKRVYTFFIL